MVKKLKIKATALSDENELNASEIAMHETPKIKTLKYEKKKAAPSKNTKPETESGTKSDVVSWIKNAMEQAANFVNTRVRSGTGNKKSNLHVSVLYSSVHIPMVSVGITVMNTKGKSEKK